MQQTAPTSNRFLIQALVLFLILTSSFILRNGSAKKTIPPAKPASEAASLDVEAPVAHSQTESGWFIRPAQHKIK